MIIVTGYATESSRGNRMNRFKLTVVLISLSCLFLLACATKVSANTSVLTSSTSAQPRLQQYALQKLTSNPNFTISNLQVIVEGDTVELIGSTKTGFQRALAQKFLEHNRGIRKVKNNLKVSSQDGTTL